MKKTTTIAMVMVLISFLASAQSLKLTMKAGDSFSDQSLSNNVKNNGRNENLDIHTEKTTGFVFGTALDISFLNSRISIQPEFDFIQKGNTITYPEKPDGESDKIIRHFNYYEIPLLIKYRITKKKGKQGVYIFAGPYYAYNSGGNYAHKVKGIYYKLNYSGNIIWSEGNYTIDRNSGRYGGDIYYGNKAFNQSDWGAIAGFGETISLGKGFFSIEARYEMSFIDFYKQVSFSSTTSTDYYSKNKTLALMVGYSYPLGK